MLGANDQHLQCLLLVEVLIDLAETGNEVLVDECRVALEVEEGSLLGDVLKADQLARQRTYLGAIFSQGKQPLCRFDKGSVIVSGHLLHLGPNLLLLLREFDQWQIESHVRSVLLEVVN